MINGNNYFVNYGQHNSYAQNQQNPYGRQPVNISVPQTGNNQYFVNYGQHNSYAQNQQNFYSPPSAPQHNLGNSGFGKNPFQNFFRNLIISLVQLLSQNGNDGFPPPRKISAAPEGPGGGYPPPRKIVAAPEGPGGVTPPPPRKLVIGSEGPGGGYPPPRKIVAAPEGPGGVTPPPPRKLVIGSEGPGGGYPPPRKAIAAPEGSGTIGTGFFFNQGSPPINTFLQPFQRPVENPFFFFR